MLDATLNRSAVAEKWIDDNKLSGPIDIDKAVEPADAWSRQYGQLGCRCQCNHVTV